VSLEASEIGALGGVVRVKVGLIEGRISSFEYFDSRTPSTPKKTR
jgi:hypothetical protein